MFYIDQSKPAFQQAKQDHYNNIRYIIKKKLLGKSFTEPHPLGLPQRINKVDGIEVRVRNFLNDETNLKNLLIGTPDVLDDFKSKFNSGKSLASLEKLLNYVEFTSKQEKSAFRFYNAFDLAKNLWQPTCIYCNRLYTHTIIIKKKLIARPAFDHWFPKGKFPILSLSFFNLIPSCTVCNSSIKTTKSYSLADYFHPYVRHPKSTKNLKFRFSYTLEDHVTAETIIKSENRFSKRSVGALQLEEVYSLHAEEVREMIYLKKAYSKSYMHSLKSVLKTPISAAEMYRLAFGVFLEDQHLHKRPLSKLKKDILRELGLIT